MTLSAVCIKKLMLMMLSMFLCFLVNSSEYVGSCYLTIKNVDVEDVIVSLKPSAKKGGGAIIGLRCDDVLGRYNIGEVLEFKIWAKSERMIEVICNHIVLENEKEESLPYLMTLYDSRKKYGQQIKVELYINYEKEEARFVVPELYSESSGLMCFPDISRPGLYFCFFARDNNVIERCKKWMEDCKSSADSIDDLMPINRYMIECYKKEAKDTESLINWYISYTDAFIIGAGKEFLDKMKSMKTLTFQGKEFEDRMVRAYR